jgi:hypothetical protein
MPRYYTLSDLIKRAKRRCDMENDPSIAEDEWADLLSEAYGELYTIAVESGMQYFERSRQYTATGAPSIGEPLDHFSTVQVAYLVDPVALRYIGLRELMAQERTQMSGLTLSGASFARAFSVVDRLIYLYPTPPAGQIYELRYVPQPPDFDITVPTMQVDVIAPNGLAFLLWNMAVMAAAKTEVDPQLASARLEQARDRFTTDAVQRALTATRHRVIDVEVSAADDLWADRLGSGW